MIAIVVSVAIESTRKVPSFPSLMRAPDSEIVGTVAYVSDKTGCVDAVRLGGGVPKELYCPPALDKDDAVKNGKPVGPQLIWKSNGILEITWFRMPEKGGPDVRPGWQVEVDVKTGKVTELNTAPNVVDYTTRETVDPDGRKVKFTSNASTGHVTVSVEDANGVQRVLLDERGPGKYTYGIRAAFWSPDFKWIIADDGRILVISPEGVATEDGATGVRELVRHSGGGYGDEQSATSTPVFAVTSEDLLS